MQEGLQAAADIVRSETRIEILDRLRASEATKYELREELDCARTTVHRNLDQLVADGWVDQSGTTFALTSAGELALEAATDFRETVAVASRLEPFLRWVPRTEFDIDVRAFRDADLTVPEDGKPIAMIDRHTEAVSSATRTRMVLPMVSAQPLEVQHREMNEREIAAEHVVSPRVAEILDSDPQFEARIDEMCEAGALEVYVTEREIPYYLGILDETVQIGVDEDGEPRALLEATAPDVREWAEQTFETFRAEAVPFEEWAAE